MKIKKAKPPGSLAATKVGKSNQHPDKSKPTRTGDRSTALGPQAKGNPSGKRPSSTGQTKSPSAQGIGGKGSQGFGAEKRSQLQKHEPIGNDKMPGTGKNQHPRNRSEVNKGPKKPKKR